MSNPKGINEFISSEVVKYLEDRDKHDDIIKYLHNIIKKHVHYLDKCHSCYRYAINGMRGCGNYDCSIYTCCECKLICQQPTKPTK